MAGESRIPHGASTPAASGRSFFLLLGPGDQSMHLTLLGLDPADNLARLDLLEGEDLVELRFELVDKVLLILLGPFWPLAAGGSSSEASSVLPPHPNSL